MLLSEMFGVERETEFGVIGYIGRFILRERPDGTERLLWRSKDNNVYINEELEALYDIIFKAPANIIHLPPPLTDEQREQLKALYTIGYPYLAKDKDETVYAYEMRPHKVCKTWYYENGDSYMLCTKQTVCLNSLVAYSDPEPYDIGKALGVGE